MSNKDSAAEVELLEVGAARSSDSFTPKGMSRSGSIDTVTVSGTRFWFFAALFLIVVGGVIVGLDVGGVLDGLVVPGIIVGGVTGGVGVLVLAVSLCFPVTEVRFDRGAKMLEKASVRGGCCRRTLYQAPFYAIHAMTHSLLTGTSSISTRGSTTQRQSDYNLAILMKDSHNVNVEFVHQKDLSGRYAEWGRYLSSLGISDNKDPALTLQ